MYHKLAIEDVLESLDVNPESGLSEKEARARHAENGTSTIAGKGSASLFKSILTQLKVPMIYVLFVAVAVSALVGEWVESLVILAIVLINSAIGVVQERKAFRALDALRKLTVTRALVRRDGKISEVPADELAVGDVVLIEPGRIVPADLRLIFSASLTIDESALTGEKTPVAKDYDYVSFGDVPLTDRINSAYQGTVVTAGRGEGIVTATGMSTEVGQLADILNSQENVKTSLQERLAKLGKVLGIVSLLACALFFVIGLIRGEKFVELLLTAVSLAVAVIPEGLTAIGTVGIALGAMRMAQKNAIVKNLVAVETLGSVTAICTDKTGALTQNRMTVVATYSDGAVKNAKEETSVPLIEGLALCNNSGISEGSALENPTETALLEFAEFHGRNLSELADKFPRKGELAFDSARKMMTTLHRAGSTTISYTKGALDSVLPNATHIFENGDIRAIEESDRKRIEYAGAEMAERALRVLALAMRSGDYVPREDKLVFVGLVGIVDLPRDEAKITVDKCRDAGIHVVMVTGDDKSTALAIGSAVDITDDESRAVTGAELDKMSDEELLERIEEIRIFSRVNPTHKVRIVRALREKGHVVALTGDGINDAPSLKASDIGIAMGMTGTGAARDAADLVLKDDDFSTIVTAVEQGRNIFENIRKSVYFLLSSNLGELILMFFAMLFGWHSPLLPLHILLINLITDSLPALALGANPAGTDVMQRPPSSAENEKFLRRGWISVGVYGAIVGVVSLAMFKIAEVMTGSLETARTCAFATLIMSQLFHSVGIRIGLRSIFKTNHLENKFMLWALIVGIVVTFAVLYVSPLALLFNTQPLGLAWVGVVIAGSLVPLIAHEFEVLTVHIRKGRES